MKKILRRTLALGCAAALLTAVGLTACKPSPVIDGDYRTPTAAELVHAVSSIDENALLRDPASDAFGFSIQGDIDLNINAAGDSVIMNGEGNYDIAIPNVNEAGSVGKGSLRLNASQAVDGTAGTYVLSGDVYHDSDNLYLDVVDGTEPYCGKIPFGDLVAILEDLFGDVSGGGVLPMRHVQPLKVPSQETQDMEDMLEELAAAGISVGLDDSAGLKLKFYANDDYFRAIEESTTGGFGEIDFRFQGKTLEVYLYINEDGTFEQFSVYIDMGYSASYPEETADYSMDAQLVIRRSQESVTLPEELYDENEYPPLDPDSWATGLRFDRSGDLR